MKKTLLILFAFVVSTCSLWAIDANTVEVKFNGNTASVTVASNISSFVTISSGNSSHVKIVQSDTFAGINKTVDNEDGEIIYVLSGTSADGEFFLEGSFKCTVELNALTLTNPTGPAINIQNGKRVSVSAKKGTTNTLTDGVNADYKGCYHCKGHTKFKGKGTLNVVGRSGHAVYSKEYVEVKNLTLNITGAVKDAIHCKQYFLMESGTVKITAATDDGIQVEVEGDTPTGITPEHEDENTGNFYMTGGTLSISGYGSKAVKTEGAFNATGGTRNFNMADVQTYSGIEAPELGDTGNTVHSVYDLGGRRVSEGMMPTARGLYIVRKGNTTVKRIVR